MTFGSLFNILFGNWLAIATTLFAFLCVAVFPFLFQAIFLRKTKEKYGVKLSVWHFALIYAFLFYLMIVYRVTGIASIWTAGSLASSFELGLVHPIPFSTFPLNHTHPLNVIMFIPLGFLLPMIWPEFRMLKKVALAGFLLSLSIELNQLFSFRSTATDDLIANTLGAVIGYFLFRLVYIIVFRGEKFMCSLRSPIHRIKHEASVYLVCAFVGMILLFNPLIPLHFTSASVNLFDFASGQSSQDALYLDNLENALRLLDIEVLTPPANLPEGFVFNRAVFLANPLLYDYLVGERGGRIPASKFLIIEYTNNDDDIIELRMLPIDELQFRSMRLTNEEITINGYPANVSIFYEAGIGYLPRLMMWNDGVAYIFNTFSEVVTSDDLIKMAGSME